NAKVGGIGDVVRDLPNALAAQGCLVHVIIPSHGFLQRSAALEVASFPVLFGGGVEQVKLYRWDAPVEGEAGAPGVQQWIVDHPGFYPCGAGKIYCNDGNDRPFASDAGK